MKIALAADHAAFRLKEFLKAALRRMGHEVLDFGTDGEASCDYPDFGRPAAEAVAGGEADLGVLCCGTGLGMSIVANKVRGIRAALCADSYTAAMARAHNNANVLVMGARIIGEGLAEDILSRFLATTYEGGRHNRRLGKIES